MLAAAALDKTDVYMVVEEHKVEGTVDDTVEIDSHSLVEDCSTVGVDGKH